MGALSSNNEIKKAVREVEGNLKEKGCWVFDRGADNGILKGFFLEEANQCIIRLKKNTKLLYKGQNLTVSQIGQRAKPITCEKITKFKKGKPVVVVYEVATVRAICELEGREYPVWLTISRNTKHGGMCYLLVKSKLNSAIEVAQWAFKGYGLRWKIEEYHRHVKQEYKLESIQIKTFTGLQSMLAVLTVAMYMIYKKIKAIHFGLLLDSGYNYLSKHTLRELTNFIYYKIGKVVSILLMPVKIRRRTVKPVPIDHQGQLNLMFN